MMQGKIQTVFCIAMLESVLDLPEECTLLTAVNSWLWRNSIKALCKFPQCYDTVMHFSALTLLAGWQDTASNLEKCCFSNPKSFLWGTRPNME